MTELRAMPFHKVPGVAETLDWGLALMSLHCDSLDKHTLEQTRGCILKAREDWAMLEHKIDKLSPIWDEPIGNRTLEPESDFGFGKVTVS
jgi:hypothetical protein